MAGPTDTVPLLHDDSVWEDIVRSNVGFERPEDWVQYAKSHGFRKLPARQIVRCPDCGNDAASGSNKIGQYIYYSNLAQLRKCGHCQLIYSTVRIDPSIIRHHFDRAYTDEDYFVRRRKDIFDQVVQLASSHAPLHGHVLDIGGAKGHAMAALRDARPDLTVVVNDLSPSKCEWVESHYGLRSLCGSAPELLAYPGTFDVITLIDVLYYEPNLSKLWDALARLLRPGGVLIIRIPNNNSRIVWYQRMLDWFVPRRVRDRADTVRSFNPEHLYVLSKQYMTQRLRTLGCRSIAWVPSALLRPEHESNRVSFLYRWMVRGLQCFPPQVGTITPGVFVVASGRDVPRDSV